MRAARSDLSGASVPAPTVIAPAGSLGLLGGIFDPVHCGHLAAAQLAIDYFGLRKLLFVPSGNPPHKVPPLASPANRLAMLRRSLRGNPRYGVWKGELRRSGTSYTIDTLDALAREYPHRQFYFIIGSDNLPEIVTWRRYREVLERVTLCVAQRPGYSNALPRSLPAERIVFFPSPQWGISSSLVRDYLKRGFTCRHMVPQPVLEYILHHTLYT